MSSSAPAGTLTQLAGQGARLVASPRRRVFPGHPDQVRQARRFVVRALDGCPAAADAVLGVSELASNAVQHTRSGQGGRFQVLVWRGRRRRPSRSQPGVGAVLIVASIAVSDADVLYPNTLRDLLIRIAQLR